MSENLLKILTRSTGEALARVYNPIRHAMHMVSAPQPGSVSVREQQELQNLYEAELHHCRRELSLLAETLEDQVLERTTELEITTMRLQQADDLAHLGHWRYVLDDDRIFCSEEVFNIFEISYCTSGISFNQLKTYFQADDLHLMKQKLGVLINERIAYDHTAPIYLPDGGVKYLHAIGVPGTAADENVSGTLQDVTLHIMLKMAMQERELELIADCHAAERANQTKSAFLSTMGQDIRTSMNEIRMSMDTIIWNLTLLGTTCLSEQQKQCLHDCTSASQILLRTINEILGFSTFETRALTGSSSKAKTTLTHIARRTARKILLADDEPVGRDIATELLERNGHTVKVVEGGKSILEILQRERFDILLSDISMPDMDGTEVAQIIRSGKRVGIDPLIPIIALTAHVFPQDCENILGCGINGYIAKPINFEELLGLIDETCGN